MQNEKISATIITHNEEKNIERCLKSLYWVDEIIAVDSYSTDRTVEICNKYNCKVIQTEWMGFGKTKKFAVDHAANDWILSIDSDEEVTEELKKRIMAVLNEPKFNGYKIKRRSFYLGNPIRYCGWDKDYPLRLFNRKFGNFDEKEVHESIIIQCDKGKIEDVLLHYTYPTISSHFNKMNRYSDLANGNMKPTKKYGIMVSLFLGLNKFLKMFILQRGFLDGRIGFLLCLNSSIGVYLKYIKSWQKKV